MEGKKYIEGKGIKGKREGKKRGERKRQKGKKKI